MTGMSLSNLTRCWQHGWGLARGLAPATEVDGGLLVTLDLPGRYQEFVAFDAAAVPAMAARAARAPRPTWLSVVTHDPESARARFAAARLETIGTHDFLMTIPLDDHPVREAPDGYGVAITETGGVLAATVTHRDGSPAARGLMGLHGTDAVAHAIATEPAHRRRGLGSVVMSALGRAARRRGATTGLLVAVPEGERLYTSLGWSTDAHFLTAAAPSLAASTH